jgi:hypothetical protein
MGMSSELKPVRVNDTCSWCSMLCLEVGQVFLIHSILRRLLVLCQLSIILFLGSLGLSFKNVSGFWFKDLPALTDNLSNLGEGEILAFEFFSDFC